ncbi:MAG: hypothetical protein AAF658_02910 [Myxococcota bacterium]
MPLTEFQAELARILAAQRSPDSYLAGGAALHFEPNGIRYSNDLDYFHDSVERVASAFEDDLKALETAGYTVAPEMKQPGYIRALVSREEGSTKVEWAHDSSWRFMPTLEDATVGWRLHPVDLAINKLLALVGRDEPRDFVDTLHLHENLLPLGAMIWAASGKDPGFTPLSLLSLLKRRGRIRPEDIRRLRLTQAFDVVEVKSRWLAILGSADQFVRERPPDDLGCLYYSSSKAAFVEPEPGERVLRHFGRPGGLLPTVLVCE